MISVFHCGGGFEKFGNCRGPQIKDFFPVWYFFISPKGGPAVYCICTRDHNGNNGVNEEQK